MTGLFACISLDWVWGGGGAGLDCFIVDLFFNSNLDHINLSSHGRVN